MKLQTAVLCVIDGFSKVGKDFSAWDVTKFIRESVNTGKFQLVDGKGVSTNTIWHNEVREIVHELYNSGMMAKFGVIDKEDNGTYQTFIFKKASNVPTTIQISLPPKPMAVDKISLPISESIWPSVRSAGQPTPKIDVNTASKINRYISLCDDDPTIKQIQSAIKVKGITCQDINDWLVDNGYVVFGAEEGVISNRTVICNL